MAESVSPASWEMPRVEKRALPALWQFRLVFGWIILVGAVVGFFSFSWDIQWHTDVGRDRTLTMPHLFILGSITLMGLAALAAVLSETWWARRNLAVARFGTTFAGTFSSAPGMYMVGFGALTAAIGFPLDQYWHTLYGVDIAIWAPFHIMILVGFSTSCLGMVELLASSTCLARQQENRGAALAGSLGVILALATVMSMLSILLPDALKTGVFQLGNLSVTVFPLMLSAFGMFVLVIAVRVLPWPGVASCVAVIYALFGLINYLIIPHVMTWLLGIEQQSLLRTNAPIVSVLAVEWQYGLIMAAVLLDAVVRVARVRKWSPVREQMWILIAGVIGFLLVALVYTRLSHILMGHMGGGGSVGGSPTGSAPRNGGASGATGATSSVVTALFSLLLCLPGVWLGHWFGKGYSGQIQQKEQH
jgi:hypothetical protein